MLEGMRRVSIVSVIAAAVVVGHLAYHLVPRRPTRQPSVATTVLPPRPWAAGPVATYMKTAAVIPPAPVIPQACRLQPPLTEADWKPMLAALRPLVERTDRRYPYLARDHREFVHRFEACGVDVRQFDDYVLVLTGFGGYWTGARFRKTPHGWIALQTEGGDIR
jgi:hypothetical protein